MSLVLKQIFFKNPNVENKYVTYKNSLQPRMKFGESYLKGLYENHYEEILQVVKAEIADYLNDETLCNDEEDMFPRRCEMTGEWYIGEVSFGSLNFLSIAIHFLGTVAGTENEIDDYLELEVCMYYDEEKKKFVFDGINSACI